MIDNLKALAAVIDNKSLTKAASRLSLTPHAAGPDPAAAESRSVLRGSASRDEISIVDATGFAMQLDI
jgi:DNA-binding transcriptional LysR family regulator